MIIGIFIALTLIWPFALTFLMGKKYIIPTIVSTLILFFIIFNTVHIFTISTNSVIVLTTICITITLILMLWFGIKNKKFTIKNLRDTLQNIWSLYLIIAIATLIRLFINHLNSDSVAYARNANYIKNDIWLSEDIAFWYRTPIFHQMASMANQPIDFFSIYGEVLHVVLFSLGLNIIIRDLKHKNIWKIILFSILVGISSVFALSFKTSGVNWSAVAIALIFIFACRKNSSILILSIPFSMSVFSFSPMLTLPLAAILFAWRKEWRLKEIIYLFLLSLLSFVFMILNVANVSYKLFLLVDVMVVFSLVFIWFINKKEIVKVIKNPLYKMNLFKNKDFFQSKKYKIIATLATLLLFIITETIMILMIVDVISFPLIIGYKEQAMMSTIPILFTILLLDSALRVKISDQFKWLLICGILIVVYACAQLVPGVPDYIVDRFSLPYSMCIGLITLTRFFEEELFGVKKFWTKSTSITIIMGINLITLVLSTFPSTIYSPFSSYIEQNYRFTTSAEREVIKDIIHKDKNAIIYSDVAISSINSVGDKHSFFTNQDRGLFFAEMIYRTKGISKQYWNSILEYRQIIQWNNKYYSDGEITSMGKDEIDEHNWVKKSLEFSFLADAVDLLEYDKVYAKKWIDKNIQNAKTRKINTFVFRRRKYFETIQKILKDNNINNIKTQIINGVYVLKI